HRHLGADARHDGRGGTARDAGAQDHHLAAARGGNAAEQHALAAVRRMQQRDCPLRGQAAGDVGHRREQRQLAVDFHGLEGDRGQADALELFGELRFGGEVQVAEQQVFLAQVLEILGDRLLDLDYHLGLFVELLDIDDLDADGAVIVIAVTALHPRARFHHHGMAFAYQSGAGRRNEAHAAFHRFQLSGDTNAHLSSLLYGAGAFAYHSAAPTPPEWRPQNVHCGARDSPGTAAAEREIFPNQGPNYT